ncbi:hypothetical protein AGDE_05809 [Angomonas deanei]|uniref:Uncharacterized protein n=1 Tax=Angomonas deanei TaxID=59799 RepID=A0A7G2CK30_9TRYP|nr:hypothetical protein AGDE_05809 [Angomonas deanei]CAD2220240.1 hypothetical protein, conserved [Angomonas deanei]|eukprot:EPY38122.1 hypothetical protein AGDE_05809 [Angomonas deanei]
MDGYDKATKPYTPMDTYNQEGTWIEEKRYNRSRPVEGRRGVLSGNWQEEQQLEQDLLQQERAVKEGTVDRTWKTDTVSLDVIRDKGNGHYTGAFNSSPYLTTDVRNPNERFLNTTNRQDFNANSSDVKQLRRPQAGVRSQQMLQQALQQAEEEQKQAEEMRQTRMRETMSKHDKGIGGNHSQLGALQEDRTTSVYKGTISNQAPYQDEPHTVNELRNDYLDDEPITLYTGNPQSGKTMTVHGKTPADPSGHTRFGKHTQFSERKYDL